MRFINLHTHHIQADDSLYILSNRFGYDKGVITTSPFSVGIHPWDSELINPAMIKDLEILITHPNCYAIGECGIDKLITTPLIKQTELFKMQLQLATKYKKPVIIHCVKAFQEIIEICRPYLGTIPLIIHGFNKSEKLAKQLTDKGFYLSMHPGIITKNNFNLKALPIDHLFLETDDNPLILIQNIYNEVALKLNMEVPELKEKINSNFEALFYDTNSR